MSSSGGVLLIPDWLHGPVWHGVYGTCFTWFVTALGAAVVFLVPNGMTEAAEGQFLDASLGFAAGVMLAASYWSLLAPAIEMAEEAGYGQWSFFPAAAGFVLGCAFVLAADLMLPESAGSPTSYLEGEGNGELTQVQVEDEPRAPESPYNLRRRKAARPAALAPDSPSSTSLSSSSSSSSSSKAIGLETAAQRRARARTWRRMMLLVLSVTAHNFPEGLCVGVAFGAVGSSPKATVPAAEVLTIAVALQNFPEGLAVSLPMRRMGYSKAWCFFFGQLSGMVEPVGGFIGAAAVLQAQPILPYALAFAAGAMVYVVVDSIIPEAQMRGNSKTATWGTILGFIVMMVLDVALG